MEVYLTRRICAMKMNKNRIIAGITAISMLSTSMQLWGYDPFNGINIVYASDTDSDITDGDEAGD